LSADKLISDATLAYGLSTSCGGLPAFAGIVDFCSRSIRFAAGGFSPPIALDRPGPAVSIQMVAGMATGSATLGLPGGALVCDSKLWRWLDMQRGGELRQLLDTHKPMGLASIVRLDSRRP
jgi:hypothetical protein